MENEILELIYDHYLSGRFGSIRNITTDSETAFIEKYITPLYQTDPDAAVEMEDFFTRVLSDSDMHNYINGFKTCLHFIMGCMDSKIQF